MVEEYQDHEEENAAEQDAEGNKKLWTYHKLFVLSGCFIDVREKYAHY